MGYIDSCSLSWVGTHKYVGICWEFVDRTFASRRGMTSELITSFLGAELGISTTVYATEVWLRDVNCTLPSCIHGWEQLQDGQEELI